jgi:hypothetical protein
VLAVKVDASNLPRKYTQVVYTHCFNFPRKLIFFLLGSFQASYLGYTTELPSIDTYFMLDCSGAKQLKSNTLQGLQGNSSSRSSSRAGAGAVIRRLQEAERLGSRGSGQQQQQKQQQQQQQRQAQPVYTGANAWPAAAAAAAAAAVGEESADYLQELKLFDWELQLHGIVPVHGSSSSSSSGLVGSSSLQSSGSSSSKDAVQGSSQAVGSRRAGWWQQLWQQQQQHHQVAVQH